MEIHDFLALEQNRRNKRLCTLLGIAAIAVPVVSYLKKHVSISAGLIAEAGHPVDDEGDEELVGFDLYREDILGCLEGLGAGPDVIARVENPDFFARKTLETAYLDDVSAEDMADIIIEAFEEDAGDEYLPSEDGEKPDAAEAAD